MKDQELKDIFHAYRPKLSDEDAFMKKLSEQMDAVDEKQQANIVPLYRNYLPWVVGIAAAIVAVVLFVKEPETPTAKPCVNSSLVKNDDNRYSMFFDHSTYDDIVNEIETSGRQLEQAIAQL